MTAPETTPEVTAPAVTAAAGTVLSDDRVAFDVVTLDDATARFAAVLAQSGVGPGQRVAWMMHNRAEVILLALASRRLGAVVVPFSYRSSPPELRRLIQVARPVAVVAERATRPQLEAAGAAHLIDVDDPSWELAFANASVRLPDAVAASTDRLGAGASMLFTSGTTGAPKAALRARGDRRLAGVIADGFGFTAGRRFLAAGPLYHSGPWTCALMALARGGAVAVRPRFDAAEWLAFAGANHITSTFITPTQLRQLVVEVEAGAAAPASLTNLVVSGEPFPPELKARAAAALGECLVECYGCTELGPLTAMPAAEFSRRPASSGRPFAGVELAAFDGETRLGPGQVGLLRARTPLAFDKYVIGEGEQPDASPGGWATVGDVGHVDEDGYVYLVGRADEMIISGGVNVFPPDVEAVVLEHPDIESCAVFGAPDERWGQVVCAAIVSKRPVPLAELRTWLRGRIADDKRPQRVFGVAALATTPTGKVSRRLLRAELLGDSRSAAIG